MGAKYSYGVWEQFADQASIILGKKQFCCLPGVVVTWPDKRSEFWFGGALFESEPGTTPFGEPLKKIKLGAGLGQGC